MKILYLSDNSSDHNRRFLEKISAIGHEVWFWDVTSEEVPQDLGLPNIHWVKSIKNVPRDAGPKLFAKLVPEFQQMVAAIEPDLVHAGPVQTCAYLAVLADFHPLVAMSWGSDMLLYADKNEEWRQATEAVLRGTDGFVCDCDAVRQAAKRFVSLPDASIAEFPWGIRRGLFSSVGPLPSKAEWTPVPGTITFLCTRSWEPLYRIPFLLQAFHIAYTVDDRLRLILLGRGSEADEIGRFIVDHQLTDVVRTPGLIRGEHLPQWFRAADVYVSCAVSDGTSISLLEAMATGLPVVVSDIPSNREWVNEGENGWLIDGSPKDFAEKLLTSAHLSPQQREKISGLNQSIVASRADWDRNFPLLSNLYERLRKFH